MPLSIGIVGLPNVGKSTLFKALTKKQIDCANYPFCTIDPNVGVVSVPDKRVDQLAELTKSAKKINTAIEFVDIAGLVKGAHKGEGLGNQFLANIRETDAVVYVLRIFQNQNIVNTQNNIDPIGAKEILETELALKDLATLDKRLESLEREARSLKKELVLELEFVKKAKAILEEGKLLYGNLGEKEAEILKKYQLLTMKPMLYLLNGKEEDLTQEIKDALEKNKCHYLILDILNELEVGELSENEKEELGVVDSSHLDNLITEAYRLLDLITFLTTGPDETRAWTIKRNSLAPDAGGVIHTDFKDRFIRAEVINWQDLLNAGGFVKAREKGIIRTEGKDYIVQDGDVIEIKHDA